MLLPLLCTLLLSTQLGVSLVVKAVLMLLLGPANNSEMMRNVTTVENSNTSNTSQYIWGTFDLESSNNFDRYLEEMGVSYFLRQLAQLAQPQVTFAIKCGGENNAKDNENENGEDDINISLSSPLCMWSIHTDAGIKIHDITFTIGEEVTKNNNFNQMPSTAMF